MFGLSPLQFTILTIVFLTVVITSERALAQTKRENIDRILDIRVKQGRCSVCLEREWKKLKKMSAIDVQIALHQIEQEQHSKSFLD